MHAQAGFAAAFAKLLVWNVSARCGCAVVYADTHGRENLLRMHAQT